MGTACLNKGSMRLLCYFLIIVFCVVSNVSAQVIKSVQRNSAIINDLNLDFEKVIGGVPKGWDIRNSQNYTITVDTVNSFTGKHSICFQYTGIKTTAPKEGSGIVLKLPHNYNGKILTLTGYIKTENATGGVASLLVNIPNVTFGILDQQITGTTPWKKYTLSVGLIPAKTKEIYIGGLFTAEGTMWLDDLEVQIDDKSLSVAEIRPVRRFPAEKDTAFIRGSGLTTMRMNKQTLTNLKVLGMVWGFLKFYHPGVAAGKYNWANTLFRLLPKIASAKTDQQRDTILTRFIQGLGPLKGKYKARALPKGASIKMSVDTSWFYAKAITQPLQKVLSAVFYAKPASENYYYSFDQSTNVVFPHDKEFVDIKSNDIGLRLLALFRYWNAVEYFYPYRYLLTDWEQVLTDYIPKMILANTRQKYDLTLLSMIEKIKDSHGALFGSQQERLFFGENTPLFTIRYIGGKWIVDRYLDSAIAFRSGIQIGDELEKINGQSIKNIVKERLDITPGSNMAVKYRNLSWHLLNTANDSMILTLERDGRQEIKKVKTYNGAIYQNKIYGLVKRGQPPFKIIGDGIAYIYPGTFKNSMLDSVMQIARSTKGMIIDLRSYPADFMVFTLGNKLGRHRSGFARYAHIDPLRPGQSILDYIASTGTENPDCYKGKVVLLINEYTQSQSEYTAMAFRALGATIIGSTTAGADGDISYVSLPGDMSTVFSGLGIYYPDGGETQQVGIVPDIICKPTITGVKAGRDEPLERAVLFIETGK